MRSSLAIFWLLAFVGCRPRPAQAPQPARAGTLVLVSIDGFRWNYRQRPEAAQLQTIASQGVAARVMEPVFPTKTFPNHYTMVTGLYPDHHGIVANTMEDSTVGGRFSLSSRTAVGDARWWGGEPIWVTAQRQGHRAAAYFWPGSEAAIGGIRPTWWAPYDGRIPYATRVTQVLDLLSLPPDSAPSFITLYLEVVDEAGHRHGPEAPETATAIARVDSAVGALWQGLADRGFRDRVNLLIVSDHGMAETSPDRVILLDEVLEPGSYRVVDWNPVAMIVPAPGRDAEVLSRLQKIPHVTAWRREQVPGRFHFSTNPRIPPIVALADEGYTITTRPRLESARRTGWSYGMHGYDNRAESMGALFVAVGPAFRAGVEVPRVRSLDLYALMTAVMAIKPAPNDGSLDSIRVVLKAVSGKR